MNDEGKIVCLNSESIETVFKKMDTLQVASLFVAHEDGKLCGLVDRSGLRGKILMGVSEQEKIEKVMSKDFPFLMNTEIVNESEMKNKIFYLQNAFNFIESSLIPICNNEMKILSFSTISDLLNAKIEREKVMITGNLSVKNICIIGGGGYLGSVLTEKLLMQGYNVRIFDNFIFGKDSVLKIKTNLVNQKNIGKFEIYEGDMRNTSDIIMALEGIDAVILLGAVVGDPASGKYPITTFEINYLAAQSIAEICAYLNINRFIFASTCSVYGQNTNGEILDENSSLYPVSHYARTKINAEKAIFQVNSANFAPTIMRMSTLYGPSYRMRYDLVVNTMMMKGITTSKITIFGGNQWRPLLSVVDAARAFIAVLESDIENVRREVFNVGEEKENYKIKDLGKIVVEFLQKKGRNVEVETVNQDVDPRDYKVSFAKIKAKLDFVAINTVHSTLDSLYKIVYEQFEENSIVDKQHYNDQNIFHSEVRGKIINV